MDSNKGRYSIEMMARSLNAHVHSMITNGMNIPLGVIKRSFCLQRFKSSISRQRVVMGLHELQVI